LLLRDRVVVLRDRVVVVGLDRVLDDRDLLVLVDRGRVVVEPDLVVDDRLGLVIFSVDRVLELLLGRTFDALVLDLVAGFCAELRLVVLLVAKLRLFVIPTTFELEYIEPLRPAL